MMAAWLTYLKSRLLPKEEKTDEYTADELEGALKYQLQRLEAFQNILKSYTQDLLLIEMCFMEGHLKVLKLNII